MSLDFKSYQDPLCVYLSDFFSQQQVVYKDSAWAADIFPRLKDFATKGKLLRGSLVLAGGALYGVSDFKQLLPLAAAMEIMHSSGLIHDDITDHDTVRRGKPSLFAQYQTLADGRGYKGERVGEGLALWVGDIGFFLAFELLGRLECTEKVRSHLIQVFAQEYVKVGLGQLGDMHLGLTPNSTTEMEILSVYRNKTARYTIALPLILVSIWAVAEPDFIVQITELSETIGLIFQLKDDELGLFGTEAEIGKPVISDVREGKKTLYYLWGMKLANAQQHARLMALFGNPDIMINELAEVKTIVIDSGARDKVEAKINELAAQAQAEIKNLPKPEWQAFFTQLLDMNLTRKK